MINNREKMIAQVTPLLGKYPLMEIIQRLKLDITPQTLSNWLRRNPPLDFPFHIVEYRCKKCKKHWRIWKLFFGRLRRKTCPDCRGLSLQIRSIPMPDVFPQLSSDVLWQGKVIPFDGVPFEHFQQKQINRIPPKYPLYVFQPLKKPQRSFHILHMEGSGVWITQCYRKYNDREALRLNGGGSVFSAKNVCLVCLNNLMTSRKPQDWKPIQFKRPQSRSYDEIELIVDALVFKNIQAACKIRNLSPKVFYNAIERHPDLYFALFLRGNE